MVCWRRSLRCHLLFIRRPAFARIQLVARKWSWEILRRELQTPPFWAPLLSVSYPAQTGNWISGFDARDANWRVMSMGSEQGARREGFDSYLASSLSNNALLSACVTGDWNPCDAARGAR